MTFSTPVSHPAKLHPPLREHLASLFTSKDLDAAVDQAARFTQATVATFAAAPADTWNENCSAGEWPAIEFVVEFFVPPPSLETFHRELEARLLRLSREYYASRAKGLFAPSVLRCVPAGSFHQYRVTLKRTDAGHAMDRWSASRSFVDGLLHQARIGWRDSVA